MDSEGTDPGNSLAVQCLGLCAFTARVQGSIQAQGTKILQTVPCSQKKKKDVKGPTLSSQSPELPRRWLVSMMKREGML